MSRHGKFAEDKTVIGFVVPKVLKARLADLAASENRTLSNFLVTVLSQYADTHAPAENAKPAKKKSAAK